jgi:transketolase C-terminal domain/subunit
MLADLHPNYLRLNVGAKIKYEVPAFTQWRKIKSGTKGTVVGTGPVVENICNLDIAKDLEIWVVSVFPIGDVPADLIHSINTTKKLITIEEHAGECGLRETLSYHIMNELNSPIKMLSLSASGYISGKYGDQKFHQAENNLGGEGLMKQLQSFL